jgi:hypothetical protein
VIRRGLQRCDDPRDAMEPAHIERLRFGAPLQVGPPQLIDLPLNFIQLLLEGV